MPGASLTIVLETRTVLVTGKHITFLLQVSDLSFGAVLGRSHSAPGITGCAGCAGRLSVFKTPVTAPSSAVRCGCVAQMCLVK